MKQFFHANLAGKILASMGFRLSLIVSVACFLSYLHLITSLEDRAEDNLEKYSSIRGQREQVIFENATKNHKVLVDELIYRMNRISEKEVQKTFERLVEKYPDGHTRSRKKDYDGARSVGVYIEKEVLITSELKRKIVVAHQVVQEFGPAMHAQFQDTYFSFPEKAIVIYWPEASNWVFEVKPDYKIGDEEWFQIGQKQSKVSRETAWTGTFFDSVGKTWMVTSATPILIEDRYIGSAHHDVMLNEIFERTIHSNLRGTFNYLVREDGRLIAHPAFQKQIESSGGRYYTSADHVLNEEFFAISNAKLKEGVLNLDDADALLGYSYIKGPGWYLTSYYPKSVFRKAASSTLSFTVIIGIISLIVELVIVFFVLRNHITKPLQNLVSAAKKLSKGDFVVDIDTKRPDELGDFARTFIVMKDAIQDRDRTLETHNRDLETLVDERTRELEQERLQKIQASKMAALGEMAGGIAHEINTPLAAIQVRANQIQELSELKQPDYDFYVECAESIDRTVERVAKIIKGLRMFSRDGSQSPFEKIIVKTVVQDTLDLASEKFKTRGVQIRNDIEEDVILMCRSVQISQVLLNLLNNACDAIENEKEKWIEIRARQVEDGYVEISVSDSGSGIPGHIAEKIMQPFFTTKGVGKGTGLGLSISRSILLEHEGDLYLDQQASNTRFVLRLPQVQADKRQAA